jgi:hypothetical protein
MAATREQQECYRYILYKTLQEETVELRGARNRKEEERQSKQERKGNSGNSSKGREQREALT